MRAIGILVTAGAMLWAGAAFAGASETAFLGKLAGAWSGTGTVTGAKNAQLVCTMTFKQTTAKLGFAGKCVAKGLGPQSFSGSISYNDSTGKYEATSAVGSGAVTVGVKSGSSVVFTSALRNMAGSGTSVMKVGTSKIVIDTNITQKSTGDGYVAHVVMTK